MGELIAILSGKGGTGKTSLCAGIATALSSLEESVLCIDCDVGLRNLDIALGMSDVGALSFLDVCSGGYDLELAACHPVYPNLRFLTAPMNCASGDIDPVAFAAMLEEARSQFSYVFLDAPAGIEAGFSLAAKYADRVILVTGADPAAIRDAFRTGTALEQMGKTNVRLIVNRVHKKLFGSLDLTIDDIMDKAGLPLLGIVPEDRRVILAATRQKPLLKMSKKGAAAACRRIAKRLAGLTVPVKI